MKKLQKICFRLSAVFAVLAVCSTLFVPARAALIDYNDYITNVSVDGDNDLVTITIPADMAYFRITKKNAVGEYKYAGDGFGSFDYKFETDVDYRIWYNPFSYIGDGLHGLDLTDIPIGTEITTRFGFNVDSWYMTDTPLLLCRYYYYEYKETPFLKQQIHKIGNSAEWDNLTDTYTTIDVKGANMLALTFEAQGFNFPSEYPAPLGVIAYDTVMTLKISSLLRLQQATGKTNQILKQVELQLAEQGKTLDDIRDQNDTIIDQNDQIINGQVKPETPDGADRFDDLDDTEAGLRDDSQAGLDTGIEITKNALQIIMQYATAFACAGWIFECFSTLPIFTALLFVSMALGVFGLVVNLAHDVDRAHRVKSAKANRTKKGG